MNFSQKKFLTLTPPQQHKHCAALLKELYQYRHHTTKRASLITKYQRQCDWLQISSLAEVTKETIEERFHFHIRHTGKGLSEDHFLYNLETQDKESTNPWLSIHTFLDGLRSAHNVGSILRTVEAFRLGDVYFSSTMMPPHHPHVRDRSMGAWKNVSAHENAHLSQLPRPWIGLETVSSAPSWNRWIYPQSATLIVGNEERGIQRSILSQCDIILTIPLYGYKNSLNVANAFAIVAAEISSQQREYL